MSTNRKQFKMFKGLLPSQSWLIKNGYRELVKAMKEHPAKFKHIPQAKDPVPSGSDDFEEYCKKLWLDYYAQGNVPTGIPERPDIVYKGQFVSWSDWLGWSEEDFLEDVQE